MPDINAAAALVPLVTVNLADFDTAPQMLYAGAITGCCAEPKIRVVRCASVGVVEIHGDGPRPENGSAVNVPSGPR